MTSLWSVAELTKLDNLMALKQAYRQYEKVRQSGRWNMITHAKQAAEEAGLSEDVYWLVLRNYSALAIVHPTVRKKP